MRRPGSSSRTPAGSLIPGGIQPWARSVTNTVVPSSVIADRPVQPRFLTGDERDEPPQPLRRRIPLRRRWSPGPPGRPGRPEPAWPPFAVP